ncbi:MAG: DUF1015 domain-containing protein [Planctomycetota bacterium]|nr:MAG: DUF1015 domain-containing protein [Planctomycetota bacterium]REJ90325.1 MAG: DUF1015 domain-containing protein [Planctomycetota bacterium]
MPDISAFAGLRYDLGHIGNLSDVVAPPYDVIDRTMQDALYERHPANVVRLILNREEPGDDETNNRYRRAARFLNNWRREGVLSREPDPALYVYHQIFTDGDGVEYTRRGFMARCGLQRFGEGNVYPHEETMSGPKADRLMLTQACRANLSQIFGLYPDPESQAQEVLEAAIAGTLPLEATDHLGVIHRIWPVTDVDVIAKVRGLLGPKPVFIADGHHRYETACNYRDQLAAEHEQRGETLDAAHPANFVLMMFVSMSDPGMIVLPTHRLFRGLPALDAAELRERIGDCFETAAAGEGSELAQSIWDQIAAEDNQGTLGLFTAKDRRWTLARIQPAGHERLKQLATEQSDDWRGLGVSILHRLLVDDLLDSAGHPKPGYVRLIDDFVGGLEGRAGGEGGREEGESYQLGAIVMPATLEHIRLISGHGERMPAKSTYFYPKLLSGLVINPLE